MCVRITLAERAAPLRFCNRYVGGAPNAVGAPQAADLAAATGLVDGYDFGVPHITAVDVTVGLHHDLRQALLLQARGPRRVRRGASARIVVTAQRVRGERLTRIVHVHVPSDLSPGTHELVLTGTPADVTGDGSGASSLADTLTVTLGGQDGTGEGPRSLEALAAAVARTHRRDAVTASFRDVGDASGSSDTPSVAVLEDPGLRVSGTARVVLHVTRR
jgi:hypothetical protein